MAGPLARSYGAATMAGKDERNGRINPALESDDDLPVAEAKRMNQQTAQAQVQKMLSKATGKGGSSASDCGGGGGGGVGCDVGMGLNLSGQGMAVPTAEHDNTAF